MAIQNAFTAQSPLDLIGNTIESAVDSVFSAGSFGKYFTGSRAIIKVNDKLFGFAFGVNYTIKTSAEEVNTIDDWTPYELAPQRITIEGTLSMFHVPGKGPTREMVQANVLSFLFHRYITIEISDVTTGQQIFRTDRAVVTSKNQSIQAGELSTITLTWKAIGWIDELTPFYPTGYDGTIAEAGNGGGLASALNSALG